MFEGMAITLFRCLTISESFSFRPDLPPITTFMTYLSSSVKVGKT
jgi:hypothetical protein